MSEIPETPPQENRRTSPFARLAAHFSRSEQTPESSDKERVRLLGEYIDQGLELIKQEKFKEAIDHFRPKEEANNNGIRFSNDAQALLIYEDVPETKVPEYANRLAISSKYKPESFTVSPSMFILVPQENGTIPSAPDSLYQESALIHAEEWIHALEHVRGDKLDSYEGFEKGALEYMQGRGVILTEHYLSRFGPKQKISAMTSGPK